MVAVGVLILRRRGGTQKKKKRRASWRFLFWFVLGGWKNLTYVCVREVIAGFVALRVLEEHLAHVLGTVGKHLSFRTEYDECNVAIAEDGKLHGLVEQSLPALVEGCLFFFGVRVCESK